MRLLAALVLLWAFAGPAVAAEPVNEAATRPVYVDTAGVIRWRDTNDEVALFGANYCVPSGSDFRMAGLVGGDRKKMIDEDMAQFARMGWTGLRLCWWGDWENADKKGNLIVDEHVDLLDYLVAKARERGIYLLLTPIHGYSPAFADQMGKPTTNVGFSRYFEKPEMGTNPKSIAAQANYIGQMLDHVNPYTGVALKDEPALIFFEVFNEPIHHPDDLKGSVAYINALVKPVRERSRRIITFFNVSQDFKIAPAIKQSNADGSSFGWYPSSLVAGHTLQGNFLQAVDSYPDMLMPELTGRPRIVYEFDSADLNSGYMYPAMARAYRSGGAQFASMFAYDALETAPYNLGWQTHFLNLVHSPRKAVSAIIAAEAMRRLPRLKQYGRYPDNLTFGDFRVSYENDSSELNAADAFMNAGDTQTTPRNIRALERIVGFGSSPLVGYEGTGAYFIDKVQDGVWRLEVYPDEVLVRDPFEQSQPDKIVSRLLYRSWPMEVHLPDLGTGYYATPIKVPNDAPVTARRASTSRFFVEPGVWLLSKAEHVVRTSLPDRINRVGFDEYHVNEPSAYPDMILSLAPKEFLAGEPIEVRARVANTVLADEVRLWLRPAGTRGFGQPIPMKRLHGNDYGVALPPDKMAPGLYEYAVSAKTGGRTTTFPGSIPREPSDWPFLSDTLWSFRVVPPSARLRLLDPKADYQQLSFVRPHENVRNGLFSIAPGKDGSEFALQLGIPDLGADTPTVYAAALYIGDAIAARRSDAANAESLGITLRSVDGGHKTVDVALIEKDGAAWTTSFVAGRAWSTVTLPLSELRIARSILIPSPFPGLWDYWREIPEHRGQTGDHANIANVERLQLTVHRNEGETAGDDARAVEVQSLWLNFADAK